MIGQKKHCNSCGETKDISAFGTRIVSGKKYPRTYCKPCWTIRNNECPGEQNQRKRLTRRRNDRLIQDRMLGQNVARFIVQDSRGADKKFGRSNDLSVPFVESLIQHGCTYCGESAIRMTCDRIDNTLGHVQGNVVPACIRCNLTRGSMPIEAWQVIAPAMREAKDKGLFGSWIRKDVPSAMKFKPVKNSNGSYVPGVLRGKCDILGRPCEQSSIEYGPRLGENRAVLETHELKLRVFSQPYMRFGVTGCALHLMQEVPLTEIEAVVLREEVIRQWQVSGQRESDPIPVVRTSCEGCIDLGIRFSVHTL